MVRSSCEQAIRKGRKKTPPPCAGCEAQQVLLKQHSESGRSNPKRGRSSSASMATGAIVSSRCLSVRLHPPHRKSRNIRVVNAWH